MDDLEAEGCDAGFGPAWLTHVWAPIDHGHIGATVKHVGREKFSEWLEQTSLTHEGSFNYEVWDRGKVTMREKRILFTWTYGEAWKTVGQGAAFKTPQAPWA